MSIADTKTSLTIEAITRIVATILRRRLGVLRAELRLRR
jgi:hypothetical protein